MIIPSVTQIFQILGLQDLSAVPKEVLEWKKQYGVAVHKSIELLVLNDLDWDSVDESIIPAVTGIEQRLKEMQFKGTATEERRIHCLFGMEYGLTLDLKGTVLHRDKERWAIIDLKTAVKEDPCWKWQLAAYSLAQEKVVGGWLGAIIQVDKLGNTKMYYYDLANACKEFQVLLAAVNIKINNSMYRLG